MRPGFSKLLIFISILFFLASCLVFVFLYHRINSNLQAARAAESEWQTENTRREQAKSLNTSMHAIQDERDQLETHFASSSDVVPFLDTIENLADSAGTSTAVTSVNILPNNAGLEIDMKSSGSFEALYRFMALLENSPYELQFYSVDLQKESVAGSLGATGAKSPTSTWDAITRIGLVSFE